MRALLDESLRSSGLDPARVSSTSCHRVGWRQPLTVTVRTSASIAIPFLFSADLPLRTTAVAHGEVDR